MQTILEKLLIPDKQRAEYTKDAEEIQNYVIDELKRVDDTFADVFDRLSLGGKLIIYSKSATISSYKEIENKYFFYYLVCFFC